LKFIFVIKGSLNWFQECTHRNSPVLLHKSDGTVVEALTGAPQSGTDGYNWDARNRLMTTLSGANFQYDALGRRSSKTIGGTLTNFLYDGLNAAQELSGTTPTANLLSGGLDELFLRTDTSGARSFLTDPLSRLLRRQPDRRKAVFRQQLQNQLRISPIVFLFSWFAGSNLCRMTDSAFDPELFHEVQKPLHRPRGFNTHQHWPRQLGIKLSHVVAFVLQSHMHYLSRPGVQHRQHLLASVQITSYNSHLGLLRSELC
jgi:hypothetical protein